MQFTGMSSTHAPKKENHTETVVIVRSRKPDLEFPPEHLDRRRENRDDPFSKVTAPPTGAGRHHRQP